ncbi:signal transduction histidine kinase [Nocardioides sp. J9]|uniref:sensor domain-containing protein n=1 Tax=Nocardioides sp. J9 TaxID=935844 RepID=UPI0011AE043B|nr:sensor domain-containing protein [Nocardioides sp. J9]TWG95061.1 signal transduction histidine kinase [Nocardioides sp. J9]
MTETQAMHEPTHEPTDQPTDQPAGRPGEHPTSELMTPTTGPDPHPPAAAPGRRRRGLVARTLHESAYALVAFPVALVAMVVVVTLVATGVGLVVVVGGILILVAAALVARGFAVLERIRLQVLRGEPVPSPTYLQPRPGDGFWARSLTALRDPQSWLDVVWSVVGLLTGTIAFSIVLAWWAAVLNGATYWFWERFLPDGGDPRGLAELMGLGDGRGADIAVNTAIGVLALLTLPLATRFAALLHGSLASVLLTSRAELQGRVARVEQSRESAHRAEAESLRRLERDIHDGPQQRLIRLGMDLGRARVQLGQDPETAARTLDEAVAQTRAAVEELRALSRGIAPPLLVDRGLAAAVAEMADGQPVPVKVLADVPRGLPLAVETASYFVVAEALTNVVKHSGATRAEVVLAVADGRLQVTVVDDGRGGAVQVPGHGLRGLQERLDGVDGDLVVSSPEGGPTRVHAEIPVP